MRSYASAIQSSEPSRAAGSFASARSAKRELRHLHPAQKSNGSWKRAQRGRNRATNRTWLPAASRTFAAQPGSTPAPMLLEIDACRLRPFAALARARINYS